MYDFSYLTAGFVYSFPDSSKRSVFAYKSDDTLSTITALNYIAYSDNQSADSTGNGFTLLTGMIVDVWGSDGFARCRVSVDDPNETVQLVAI